MGEKKLSVCMIVKDEERYIRNCLESVQDIADEIVVVDTGSTDNTKAIAKDFGAKIFDFPWVDDFSAARNFSLEKATGDWVLLLDADEELDVSSKDKVLELVNKDENVAYLVNVINFLDFTKQRTVTAKRMLLFPMRAEPYFINPIHEQLRFKKNVEIRDSTIIIKHYGYIPETVSTKKKSERNISILKKIANNAFENIDVEIKAFNYYNLGVEYYRKQEYEKALQNFQKSFLLIRKKEPGFKYALIWHIVNSLINLKKFQEALKVIEDAEQLYPWYVDLVYFKGVVYYNQRSYKKAIETFMKCLEIGESLETSIFHYDGTGSYLASYGIGSCEEALGNYNKALVFYEMSLAQNYILAVIPILKLYYERGSYHELEEKEDKLLRKYKDYSFIIEKYVDFLFLKGDYERALKVVNSYLSDQTNKLIKEAELYLHLKKYEEAKEVIEKLDGQNLNENHLMIKTFLRILLNLSLKCKTEEIVWNMKKLTRAEEIKWQIIGNLLLAAFNNDVLKIVKNDYEKYEEQLTFLMAKFLDLELFEAFEKIYNLYQKIEWIEEKNLKLGKLYFATRYYDSAVEELLAAVEKGVADAEAFYLLGKIAHMRGLIEEAETFIKEAISREKQLNYYLYLIGLLQEKNDLKSTKEVLQEASTYYPDVEILKSALQVYSSL